MRRLRSLALLALAACTLAAFSLAPRAADPLAIGASAPMTDAPMTTTAGETLTLADAAGENGLLVMFTCNTCPYVKAWEDRYNAVAEAAAERGIGMVAVNPNVAYRDRGDSMADMQARAKAQGYAFPYAVDENAALADAFGATKTPELFLFDADMTLVYHGAIDDNAQDAEAVEAPYAMNAMQALAAGEEVAEPVTKSIGCSIKRAS
jgi:peroxiredoxin